MTFLFSVLKVTSQEHLKWKVTMLQPGLVHYNFEGYINSQKANQIINILEVDVSASSPFEILIVNPVKTDSLSSVANSYNAIAGINGTYETNASFVKCDGELFGTVDLEPGHLRYWKHEGALFVDSQKNNFLITFGSRNSYLKSGFPNVLSGAPMLIDNYVPVGTTFIGDVSKIDINKLEYEDYRRHQGVRHPRTAIAITSDNKLLLITVDGRRSGISEGMSAKELTLMIKDNFDPLSALNIDGGGSTTMWTKYHGLNGVVNYPTDNKVFDHYGQRKVRSFILVKEK